ncbi:unnamed protein product [Trichogramma brassicae]|uniref:SPT2 homolog N-terminal domain-containing protein n=1 Tax=Trichogramma brassicae TaxID=86971 RepID=A0A6H5IAV2_9HYME|nr:unnamed protein product [Trichogramma brassicae]
MDFHAILDAAKQNKDKFTNKPCLQTKFQPLKKVTKQSKSLSDNIKKFLAKKEEEDRQKALEEKRKREQLEALRDHKAQSRINKHLKVCKAANKSVLDDAINHQNTAVTIAGPSQCDEDDYGYVSQEASAFYDKLMNKYNAMPPEKSIFSSDGKKSAKDIASTKDRVRQALKVQELEETLPHRRKRSKGNDEKGEELTKKKKRSVKDEKPKIKKKPMPPPMDFQSLLALAAKKQYEPVALPPPKPKEEERPMTKKQMMEYAKEKEWRERKEQKNKQLEPSKSGSSSTENGKPISSAKTSSSKSSSNTSADKIVSKSLPSIPKKVSEKSFDKSTSSSNKIVEKSNGTAKAKSSSSSSNSMISKSTERFNNVIYDTDEEEYDSELDDFIDDGPEEGEDYSKYISEIFGYDKNKYRHIDEEDDAAMESNLEDIALEKKEKALAAARKKHRR